MKIKLTENDLRTIVTECVKQILKENFTDEHRFERSDFDFNKNRILVGNRFRDLDFRDKSDKEMIKLFKTLSKEKPNVYPHEDNFFVSPNQEIWHDSKSNPQSLTWADTHPAAVKKKREKISKPEGMSDDEFVEKFVKPNNEKFTRESESYPDEEFRPIRNSGRYFGGEADYSKSYEISNYGRLRILDYDDAAKCRIVNGYAAPTSKSMQFNLNGENHTCPPVHSFVADAFLEPKDPHEWAVKHIDGDWHNNKADNLTWVRRKSRRNNLSPKLK